MNTDAASLSAEPLHLPDGSLLLEWVDGHQTNLTPEHLRRACPCALCLEERKDSSPLRLQKEVHPASFQIRRIERVGRYALAFAWGDGHNTGIYPFPLLRSLCDCYQCRQDQDSARAEGP